MKRLAVVLGILLGAAFGAQAQWNQDGVPAADDASRKSAGDFGAMLVFTDRPEEFLAAWERAGAAAPVPAAETVARGKRLVGFIVFTGCAADARGNCNAVVTFKLFKPDGSSYGDGDRGELWSGKPAPRKNQLQLSVGGMAFVLDPGDPLGRYTMIADIEDLVSGKKLHLEKTFVAVER